MALIAYLTIYCPHAATGGGGVSGTGAGISMSLGSTQKMLGGSQAPQWPSPVRSWSGN